MHEGAENGAAKQQTGLVLGTRHAIAAYTVQTLCPIGGARATLSMFTTCVLHKHRQLAIIPSQAVTAPCLNTHTLQDQAGHRPTWVGSLGPIHGPNATLSAQSVTNDQECPAGSFALTGPLAPSRYFEALGAVESGVGGEAGGAASRRPISGSLTGTGTCACLGRIFWCWGGGGGGQSAD